MGGESSLRVIKVYFITKDGKQLAKSQLTDEEYQSFCDIVETERIKYKITWPEMDERYDDKAKDSQIC